jgi:hypothetical protein
VLLLALIFSAQGLARCASHELDSTLVTFSPLLLTLGLWMLVVRGGRQATATEAAAVEAPPARAA